jgi:hypothetical protein
MTQRCSALIPCWRSALKYDVLDGGRVHPVARVGQQHHLGRRMRRGQRDQIDRIDEIGVSGHVDGEASFAQPLTRGHGAGGDHGMIDIGAPPQ